MTRALPLNTDGVLRLVGVRPQAAVLVVDDVGVKRAWMSGILEAAGHRVIEASDGRQALIVLGAETIDIVVTDINMPGMGGVELIHEIRRSASPNMKILAVSGGTDRIPSDVALGSGAAVGADSVLYLPCNLSELIERVAQLLAA